MFYYLGFSNKNLERSNDKIVSDSLEALVGAIHLDGGLRSSDKFILNKCSYVLHVCGIPIFNIFEHFYCNLSLLL